MHPFGHYWMLMPGIQLLSYWRMDNREKTKSFIYSWI